MTFRGEDYPSAVDIIRAAAARAVEAEQEFMSVRAEFLEELGMLSQATADEIARYAATKAQAEAEIVETGVALTNVSACTVQVPSMVLKGALDDVFKSTPQ